MAWYARFDGVDGSSESRSAPSVSEIVVTKWTDVSDALPFSLEPVDGDIDPNHDGSAPSFGGAGDDVLIGGVTTYDGAGAAPISTGDLADWQENFGAGGMTAAVDGSMSMLLMHAGFMF